jgi:DNA-directed RNA polymerase subunit L
MEIRILEESDDMMKVEIDDVTLVNLLNEKIWKQRGIEFSAYNIEHPYLSKPVITVRSKNPKKALIDAADKIIDDVDAIRKKLQAVLK